jgi:hypothetical protein
MVLRPEGFIGGANKAGSPATAIVGLCGLDGGICFVLRSSIERPKKAA